jgi:nucleoside-diphosphate-sugar epimerase
MANDHSNDLILITGATGHLGFATLIEALSRGYKVRAAVRSEAKFNVIASAPSTQPYASQLTSVVVPDITTPGAFDDAVKDVKYIVHLASPLILPNAKDFDAEIIQPAIRGTVGILESATKSPSVKRVVITSSSAAVVSASGEPYTADNVEEDPKGPFEHFFVAYLASKKLAYSATRRFVAETQPAFEVTNIMPSFVIGPNKLATTPQEVDSGSNTVALTSVLGKKNPAGTALFVCHVDDVAFAHIEALEPKYEGSRNWGVNWNGLDREKSWDSANEIVRKHFPKEVESGLLPANGEHKSIYTPFDASATEKAMGRHFKDWETMIVDLVGYYVKVSAGSAKNGASL